MSIKTDTKVPIEMHITIASAEEAIEYWLSNVVFKDSVKIEKVSFSEKDHFSIKFKKCYNEKECQRLVL